MVQAECTVFFISYYITDVYCCVKAFSILFHLSLVSQHLIFEINHLINGIIYFCPFIIRVAGELLSFFDYHLPIRLFEHT